MPPLRTLAALAALPLALLAVRADDKARPDKLPDTKPLAMKGDIAEQLVAGVDKFLLREIDASVKARSSFYKRDFSSHLAYDQSVEPNRKRLAFILGVRDKRHKAAAPEVVANVNEGAILAKTESYEVRAVRWAAFGDVRGEGLLLTPTKGKPVADVVAIPDADVTPEQLCGMSPGVPAGAQYARRLAESGCRVLVPVLIDRTFEPRNGRAKMTSREYLYRSAFEMGRHVIGYEVQKILAAVDWFAAESGGKGKVGVYGYGEGGMLALYAAALDNRINAACVSGYFGKREGLWTEPIERNVFGLLEQFGDAELAALVAPRTLVIEHARAPERTFPSEGGAPGKIVTPSNEDVKSEFDRAVAIVEKMKGYRFRLLTQAGEKEDIDSAKALEYYLEHLCKAKLTESGKPAKYARAAIDAKARQKRQLDEIDRHTQQLLEESPYVRRQYMAKLDTKSLEAYEKSVAPYREYFAKEVVGQFQHKLLPVNPRTKKFRESDRWTMYQVVLDVYDDVIAYGLLTIPNDIKKDEKRPVVVCQHGLEGRPEDTIDDKSKGYQYYKAFATKLAERGFITFAPQNLYIGHDKFRTLQRKANPIKKTLFSVIVPQHQQITDWLKTLPNVDGKRIGFYGLSYGGKTAMRVPPLVSNYALSICSADYNDWVWKNASTRDKQYSYVWSGEYEIFEFDLGSTFNYSEMAALIAPRPFMVERGHFDGVAPDERVALEFAKVRFLYQGKLKIGDRTTIEWFDGPHTINGKGTFEFLHKHLNWPAPGEKK